MRRFYTQFLSLILVGVANAAMATTPLCPGCPLSTAEGPPQPACIMGAQGGCSEDILVLMQTLSGVTSEKQSPQTLNTAREQIKAMQAKPQSEQTQAYLTALLAWMERIEAH